MIGEAARLLSDWSTVDTWIVLIAALAAMACALPGVYLLLRRQSMLGDALSHTVLPGIVLAFLASQSLRSVGWLDSRTLHAAQHAILFGGALISGLLTALLTQWVQRRGRVEASAALGVVYTSLFALGLLLLRLWADNVHIDPDCVLFGAVENIVISAEQRASVAWFTATVLGLNLLLMLLFYKELRISTFDPALATSLGIPAQWMQLGLVAVTAATLVTAFEIVGSILVVAMLIVPAATARLCTDRLGTMIAMSLAVAAASAVLGHAAALTLPALIFQPLGFDEVRDANTAGMMAVAAGGLLVLAALLSPRYGWISRALHQMRLSIRIAAEDLLGRLYRQAEEQSRPQEAEVIDHLGQPLLIRWLAAQGLKRKGYVRRVQGHWLLTDRGHQAAARVVRAHRLWESYLAAHQQELPDDQLHFSAHRAEHFIDRNLQAELAKELQRPAQDPHGRDIPGENGNGGS